MRLIIELLIVFAGAFAIGLFWQRKSGWNWGLSAHRAMVVGMVAMLVYYVILVIAELSGLHPEPIS